MRYLFGFLCVCALGATPLVGCSETAGDGGSGGSAGSGGMGGDGGTGGIPECQDPEDCDDGEECTADTCADNICVYTPVANGTACDESNECSVGTCSDGACDATPVADGTACGNDTGTCEQGGCQVACTEQGLRDAIAAGGGPYTFGCNGPQTVVTEAEIVIDNDVILDGEGNLTVDGKDDHRVFSTSEGVAADLIGFTVTRGSVIWPDGEGGGIRNAGELTLLDTSVRDNQALPELNNCPNFGGCPARGGGIFNDEQGKLALTNSAVSGNSAGGIFGDGSVVTLLNSTVSDNAEGAGIEIEGLDRSGVLTLTSSTVSGNARSGIAIGGLTLTVENSTVSENAWWGIDVRDGTATVSKSNVTGNGRTGIRTTGDTASLTVSDSTVSGNAEGGIRNAWMLTVVNSTMAGNEVAGLINQEFESEATLINSTVSGNAAGDADGIVILEGTVTLVSSTVFDSVRVDTRVDPGDSPNSASIVATKTLIDGACTREGAGITWISNGYNIESPDDTCGFDQGTDLVNITEGQLDLGPLQDNGGPTMTHALGAGSVAIDHIPADMCGVDEDQRGVERPQGDACDVGAVEMEVAP